VIDSAGVLQVAAELRGLQMPNKPLPPIGDDRGCADPYREFIVTELEV